MCDEFYEVYEVETRVEDDEKVLRTRLRAELERGGELSCYFQRNGGFLY